MRVAVIQFPGSNCDRDCVHALQVVCGQAVTVVWHQERALPAVDAVVLPGGFSYGDYLRAGAMAAHSPIIAAVKSFAGLGGLVLGICNGFQILTETGLLPGALLANRQMQFVCRTVTVRVERTDTAFTRAYAGAPESVRSVIRLPIAHGQGNFSASPDVIRELEQHGQVLLRYCTADGVVTGAANPNGSTDGIAGICSRDGNVMGLMPHPERISETLLGGTDGLGIFRSMIAARK